MPAEVLEEPHVRKLHVSEHPASAQQTRGADRESHELGA
jgi:hypothetical protein